MATTTYPPFDVDEGAARPAGSIRTGGIDPRGPDALPPAPAEQPGGLRPGDPRWARPALAVLLVGTAVLYVWGLGASGWANTYYAAAVQAATKSWKAFFFGSTDSSNFITVDKAPASLWVMALSARVFGLSSWSILVPQAVEGVAAVAVLYTTVKRWFGSAAGLIAGAVLATTPVAALMFRFNNPDALLTLLLTAGAYAIVRAIESGRTKWLVLAGSLIGFGFLTKMLQAFVVVPVFAGAYLLAGPPALGRRMRQVVVFGLTTLAAAGWWVAIVELTPASARPYIGGSRDNSLFNLIFGYNGFGRLTGNENGSVGGGAGTTGRWGATGWLRMFNSEFGGQASWLIPGALILLGGLFLLRMRAPRTDRTRAAVILWGGWLLLTAAVFSLGQGIIHPYYTVALAPAIGASVGIGAVLLWQRAADPRARGILAAAVAASAIWSATLLARTPGWQPLLRAVVLVGGCTAAAAILVLPRLHLTELRVLVGGTALAAVLAGPFAYSVATAATAHSGAIPTAGPAGASQGFGGPGGARPGGASGPLGQAAPGGFGGPPGNGRFAGGGGSVGRPPGNGTFAGNGGQTATVPGGNAGGLLNGSTPSAALVSLLQAGSDGYTWTAATVGANSAAGYQLATGDAVMAIGGFNGTDPAPTLEQFEAMVAAGDVHYFIAGGGFGGGPGGQSAGTASAISQWVADTFTSTTVGNETVYDLTDPTA
jgi:4-amino-4-deoxy-L-arabinose transferase-like glycosyltransferase